MWDNFGMLKNLLRKWWFWVLVAIIVVLGALYLPWYIPWKLEQWGIERQRAEEQAIWEEYEATNRALDAAYKNDAYGGATPEKTLELFIEALEAKDYELASKYFVVEKQKETKEDLKVSASRAFIESYVAILSMRHVVKLAEDGTGSDIEFFDSANEQVHFGQMVLNPYSKKWKIVEL